MKTLATIFFLASVVQLSCSQPKHNDEMPTLEITPGAEAVKTDFFSPFEVDGIIQEVSKKGQSKVFRLAKKTMDNASYDNQPAIKQVLEYFDKNKKPTGTHTTFYDPQTLQVLYWQYDNKSNGSSFAFKADGTILKGTQDLKAPEGQWQGTDLGVALFQNESREMLFRALSVPLGTVVKFPVIGMQPPFHGWVNYKYAKNEKVSYEGEEHEAKIWEAASDPKTYYMVIDKAPYVIKREVNAGKGSKHVFTFGN